jgi:hypothetical protein
MKCKCAQEMQRILFDAEDGHSAYWCEVCGRAAVRWWEIYSNRSDEDWFEPKTVGKSNTAIDKGGADMV